MTVLQDALALAEAGYLVFPCGQDKRPRTRRGFKDATDDPQTIRGWSMSWNGALIGLSLPAGTMVIDVDSAKPTFDAKKMPKLPPTVVCTTRSGGRHYFFRTTEGREPPQGSDVLGPAIDTRVAGLGYVIAWQPKTLLDHPPSTWAEAPAFVYETVRTAVQDTAREPMLPLSTDDGIVRWLGGQYHEGDTEESLVLIQQVAYAAGLIIDADPSRPWTDADWRRHARQAIRNWDPVGVKKTLILDTNDESSVSQSFSDTVPGPSLDPLSVYTPRPLEPLLYGFLSPDATTALYGDGGVGKGTLAAWFATCLTKAGVRVLILDWEDHKREWYTRMSGFGGDLALAYHVAPLQEASGGSLLRYAPRARQIVADLGIGYVIVDSGGYAAGDDPAKADAAQNYGKGLQLVCGVRSIPSLTLLHVSRQGGLEKPYGSIFWHAAFRVTWSAEQRMSGILLVNRKANEYEHQSAQIAEVRWLGEEPANVTFSGVQAGSGSPRDVAGSVMQCLAEADEPMTVPELQEALGCNRKVVWQVLDRAVKAGNVTRDGEGRGATYSLS